MAASQSSTNGEDALVFRIGAFDRSSGEFSGGAPRRPLTFVVGHDDVKSWYAAQQPAPMNAASGDNSNVAAAPRAIQFQIAGAPAAAYRMRIAGIIEGSSVPDVRVTVNAKQGTFYLHPKLDYTMGDMANSANPAYSYAEVVFSFPGKYLQPGTNTITLQTIQEGERAIPDTRGLMYDAVELDTDPRHFDAAATSAQIQPTVFYKEQGSQLGEMIDVFIRYGEARGKGKNVELTLGGKHYQQPLTSSQEFGEEKVEFAVPEFSQETPARVEWTVAGRKLHREESLQPQKKWTLFLVPHIHLDVGYSDFQSKVAAIQAQVIDQAMDLIDEHPDFRFSLDGYWPMEQFLKTRTPAEQRRAIDAVKNGHLLVPAQYAILLTGFPSAETLIRSLYGAANFSRENGTPFNYANSTDVPSYSWSYASILASAGVEYFLAGSHNDRAPVLLRGHLNQTSPFWWEGPDGKKVLMWYSLCYLHMQLLFGLPPQLAAVHDTVPLFLQQYENPGYHASSAFLFGTQVENTDLFPEQAKLAQDWDSQYAYPHIVNSGFHEALKYIANQAGDSIPTVNGDGGPYWEEGVIANAFYAAIERENDARAPSAEKLQTLSSLVNPHYAADKPEMDRMWENMVLMAEHTWTSFNSGPDPKNEQAASQRSIKEQYAVKARAQADFLRRSGMANITESIPADPTSLVVFNLLNWKRSGMTSLDLNLDDQIVDTTTGQPVPFEEMPVKGADLHRVQFIATDVPAFGYKVYLLRQGPAPARAEEQGTENGVMENAYYRIELDPATGAVRSIYDKDLKRELVDQTSHYRFGQYLYVTGADEKPNSVLQYREVSPKPDLQIHPASGGRLVSITRMPLGLIAKMESSSTNTPNITSQIRLFDQAKKIEFVEDVNKTEVFTKEAAYFAFPFAMDSPQFQYEIQNGVVNPAENMYPGAGEEWFSVQHWVSAQQSGISGTVMPLDAPLVTLGDISRGAWPNEFGKRPGTIFSFLMDNYWYTNWPAGQGGNFHFRYVVTSAPSTDPVQLSRMGWQEFTPLESGEAASGVIVSRRRQLNHPLPQTPPTVPPPLVGKESSFFDVQDSNLIFQTLKPAEDGNGIILRFLDFGGSTRTVTVRTPLLQLTTATQTTAVETDDKPLPLVGTGGFQFSIHPHEIVTVRLVGKDALPSPKL